MLSFRFGLRTLLLATLVVGCGLGWRLRPYSIEERWPNGELRSQSRVRRAWTGALVTAGQQQFWWANGTMGLEGESYGSECSRGFPVIELRRGAYFLPDGTPCSKTEFEFEWLMLLIVDTVQPTTGELASFPETDHTRSAPQIRVR